MSAVIDCNVVAKRSCLSPKPPSSTFRASGATRMRVTLPGHSRPSTGSRHTSSERSLRRADPTVDTDRLAGDAPPMWACQEDHQCGLIVWCADSEMRQFACLAEETGAEFVREQSFCSAGSLDE